MDIKINFTSGQTSTYNLSDEKQVNLNLRTWGGRPCIEIKDYFNTKELYHLHEIIKNIESDEISSVNIKTDGFSATLTHYEEVEYIIGAKKEITEYLRLYYRLEE